MKKLLIALFICGFFFQSLAYNKLSLVERYTNCSCGPCATLNNSWYNAVTANLIASGDITHLVYNVNWPGPLDPMYVLNASDNSTRWGYYGVNSVPWIDVNGTTISTTQSAFMNAVNNGNAEYSPFKIVLTPEKFSNDVINVHVVVVRDTGDNTTFSNAMLRIALTEKQVARTCLTCCTNGETEYYSICRKMLPDANGTTLDIPAPGDSTEYDFQYIPTQDFLDAVNLDSIRVVAFIQNDDTKEVYQSTMTDIMNSDNLDAAFNAVENLGISPFTVQFNDYSTATDSTSITSWAWDFNNDGVIDSNDPNPTWTYTDKKSYTVSLTVSDGIHQYTRTLNNYVTVIGASSDILVVNGIEYATYPTEMQNFYNSSACFGNHQVDVWDLFGDQGFDYSSNSNIVQVDLFKRNIPDGVLNHYHKVIWIGNNYDGDFSFYDTTQVLQYVQNGGNFLLATRQGNDYFSYGLKQYCGISSITSLQNITQLIALDDSLVNMNAVGDNSRNQFVMLDSTSLAIPIFDYDTSNSFIAGFRIKKENEGAFIYIAGRPYRFDNNASYQNYNYIIDKWMNFILTSVEQNGKSSTSPGSYSLSQNYPNPFNPSTVIEYNIKEPGLVRLTLYDMLGRKVKTLVNRNQSAGSYRVNVTASNLASGVYIYRLESNNFVQSRKMILIK